MKRIHRNENQTIQFSSILLPIEVQREKKWRIIVKSNRFCLPIAQCASHQFTTIFLWFNNSLILLWSDLVHTFQFDSFVLWTMNCKMFYWNQVILYAKIVCGSCRRTQNWDSQNLQEFPIDDTIAYFVIVWKNFHNQR